MSVLLDRLERLRKKLVDTGRRNRLVNFRSQSASGSKLLEKVVVVSGEDPEQVFTTLVIDGRAMSFVGKPDREAQDDEEVDAEEELRDAVDQEDDKLNTLLTRSRLDRHLTKIQRDQVVMLEEQGVNALFIALGLLEWQEPEPSKERRLAPLILVPVVLERTERGGFKLRWDGGEIGSNLSLAALLKDEFAIELPLVPTDEFSIPGYFDLVEHSISQKTGWSVKREAIVLSFFAFAKYLIYRDLAPKSWPEGRRIEEHAVLNSLLETGFDVAESSLGDETFLDEFRPVGGTNEVFDADGSQTLAILQALSGGSMVIEGPPGTGKSQTIANLIAEFVARGKKVLFVSEKAAALNVVFDRLKRANLAAACLEIHGTKSNKRAFYQALEETLEEARPKLVSADDELRRLEEVRGKLNQFVSDLHAPFERRGISPRAAIEHLVTLGPEIDTLGRVRFSTMDGWTHQQFLQRYETVAALERQRQVIGLPKDHPFFGSERTYISPDDKRELRRTIDETLRQLDQFDETCNSLAARLCLEPVVREEAVQTIEKCVEVVLGAPDTSGVNFRHQAWLSDHAQILETVATAIRQAEIRDEFADRVAEKGWLADLSSLQEELTLPGSILVAEDQITVWESFDQVDLNVQRLIRAARVVSLTLGVEQPTRLWAMDDHARLARRFAGAPDCHLLDFKSASWCDDVAAIQSGIETTRRLREALNRYSDEIKKDSWGVDVSLSLTVLERDGGSLFKRLFGGEFRRSSRFAQNLITRPTKDPRELANYLTAIVEVQSLRRQANESASLMSSVCGTFWQGLETDLDHLNKALTFLSALHGDIAAGRVPATALQVLAHPAGASKLYEAAEQLDKSTSDCLLSIDRLREVVASVDGGQLENTTGDTREKLYTYFSDLAASGRPLANELLQTPIENQGWAKAVLCFGAIREASACERVILASSREMEWCFTHRWRERTSSSLRQLPELATWVIGLLQSVSNGEIPNGMIQFLETATTREGISESLSAIRAFRESYHSSMQRVIDQAEFTFTAPSLFALTLREQRQRIQRLQSAVEEIEQYFMFNRLAEECRNLGLHSIVQLAITWSDAPQRLCTEFTRSWCNGVLEEAMVERTALREFDRSQQERSIAAFMKLDEQLIYHNRARVAYAHWRQVPRASAVGETGFLRVEMKRARGHKAIRVAMQKAPNAIQEIKPVFLMSPMSVSMYLPQDGPFFDVTIFDEASQIRPEEALGSIARSKQVIVVGDTKQMPPTSFFDKITGTEESDDDEESDSEGEAIGETESILALTSARIPNGSHGRRDLRWHYRSRHESLIATSNRLFYRDRLVVFPHVRDRDGEMGVIFKYCPNTEYGRGGTRKNPLEARAVVEAVIDHVHRWPEVSLGVVALSKAQQEAIEDELDLARRSDQSLREFDQRHGMDRLFVKNLESVQGDERDVIFISIGYGKDVNGFLGMSFGPINREGGERRLNVLITRARLRTVVFSNFRSRDMRMDDVKSLGVQTLHQFLAFAESGSIGSGASIEKAEPSYFEECVYESLRTRGYDVVKQVGSESYYLDMAIRHPTELGRYVIGIECDGDMYRSARTARDRDRLRQQVLESRGWRIHRIWCSDWWRHPERELDCCVQAIECAIAGTPFRPATVAIDEAPELPSAPYAPFIEDSLVGADYEEPEALFDLEQLDVPDLNPVSAANRRSPLRYQESSLTWNPANELAKAEAWIIADLVIKVANDEAPVHFDEVIRRIREAAGKGRAGSQIRDAVKNGVLVARKKGKIDIRGDFIYRNGQTDYAARDRSSMATQHKRIELVAPEEIAQAARDILVSAVAIEPTEAVKPIATLLGIDRVSEETKTYIEKALKMAVKSGVLELNMGKLRPVHFAPERVP